MKPPAFEHHAPETLEEALEVLARTAEDAKVLAGGQSLIPLLNMRLAAPGHLVDINRVASLDTLEVTREGVRVGALARHTRVEHSAEAADAQPLLRAALRQVAHPVVRNRGTVVGSLAHADPAAELPAVLAVLEGTVEAVSSGGRRTIPAAEFFAGPLESSLRPGELAAGAFFPALPARTGTAFAEVARRHGDYAMAGAAAVVTLDDDQRVCSARVGYLSVAATPLVLDLTGVLGHRPPVTCDWAAAAAYARDHIDTDEDIHASADYRRHLAGVLTERTLRAAAQEAL
ncbi:xanthine dehydrogenase family protein subunit M [Actinoallomurus bryophytorum]|uniref:Carbon-monoxide dehydrogenase medium subunit n=1 Tax=Actinoallomurus bryophytorum TaxID=1490222 RepID=A0A543CC12_9ACTN|nr:FAD binding domain-containing protein [Actinoallomurus bryophytorum]TQL94599.1 carbon-monoxide dehydrogenase medium subunit [Actinoallomurus bryophytorum]